MGGISLDIVPDSHHEFAMHHIQHFISQAEYHTMDSDHELVQQFLEIIEDSDLKYPLGQLIASFVRDAAVPSQALAYIHKICRPEPSSDFNHNLLEAAKDWSSIVEASKFFQTLREQHSDATLSRPRWSPSRSFEPRRES